MHFRREPILLTLKTKETETFQQDKNIASKRITLWKVLNFLSFLRKKKRKSYLISLFLEHSRNPGRNTQKNKIKNPINKNPEVNNYVIDNTFGWKRTGRKKKRELTLYS